MGGQVEGVILALGAVAAHMKTGALKAIAISSPFPELPDVPTLTQAGLPAGPAGRLVRLDRCRPARRRR